MRHSGKRVRGMLMVALSALVVAPAGAAPAPARFDIKRLAVEGEVLALVPVDLDGDKHLDLLAATRTGVHPRQKRSFAVFWNLGRTFAAKPDVLIPADEGPFEAVAFDVADVDGVPGAEILTLGGKGVAARSLRGRKPGPAQQIVTMDTLFYKPARGALPRLMVAHELGPPGAYDLLIPAVGALEVFRRAGAGYTRAARLEVDMEWAARLGGRGRVRAREGSSALNVSYQFPALALADSNADGRRDILMSLDDRLAVYQQGPGGSFPERPNLRRQFEVRSANELTELQSGVTVTVTDIDSDKRADVVVRKEVARGITSATSTNLIYFGRPDGFPGKPDQVIRSEGLSGNEVELHDVTGDGHTDLTLPSVNIGVMAIVRILTTKTVKINFQVHAYDPRARRFAEKPAAERQLKFKVSLSGEAGSQALDTRGDYNGDRRPDLAFGTDDDELSIFPGTGGEGLYDDDAIEEIPVPAFGNAESVDLDGVGKSDLVLYYPRTKGLKSQIVVLVNKGKW